MKAYIRSYFDGDFEKFKRRFRLNESFLEIAKKYGFKTTYVAQCWTDEVADFVKKKHPEVVLDRIDEPLHDAGSFNYILKNYLYNTDEDYIMHMDDDVYVNDLNGAFAAIVNMIKEKGPKGHINFENYFSNVCGNKKLLKILDNKKLYNKEHKKLFAFEYKYMNKLFGYRSQICILNNTKKNLNKELYSKDYSEFLNSFVADDVYFFSLCKMEGIPFYKVMPPVFTLQNGWGDKKLDSMNIDMPKNYASISKTKILYPAIVKDIEKNFKKEYPKKIDDDKSKNGMFYFKNPIEIDENYLIQSFENLNIKTHDLYKKRIKILTKKEEKVYSNLDNFF